MICGVQKSKSALKCGATGASLAGSVNYIFVKGRNSISICSLLDLLGNQSENLFQIIICSVPPRCPAAKPTIDSISLLSITALYNFGHTGNKSVQKYTKLCPEKLYTKCFFPSMNPNTLFCCKKMCTKCSQSLDMFTSEHKCVQMFTCLSR